ncbi:MAG: metal-dependent transcriptional regulator [Clostridia bacterium]|nr:metal-dependent transcriptional regulator [Clostridia bacterium]
MKIHSSAEDYLETILVLHQEKGKVRSVDVANRLGYSKPSISVAMKNLKASGDIDIDDHGYINLTDKGRAIAENIYERHLLLTRLFISLGVSPDVARDDSCRIEHVISQETFDRIKDHVNKYLSEKD